MILLYWVFMFMGVLICMPFFTLYERKIMGYVQNRKGPKKVSFMGLLQPVFDGIKLIMKESCFPMYSNFIFFILSSLCVFLVMVMLWSLFPSKFSGYFFNFGLLIVICISSLKVYFLMGSGWSSKSKYSLLGSMRGCSQVMSYEVCLMFLIMVPSYMLLNYKLFFLLKKFILFEFLMLPLIIIWMFLILAETNRSPFDFAEGESELVSGFKTEYSSLKFSYLILGEYGGMLFMSFLLVVLFMKKNYYLNIFFLLFMANLVIWARSTFPRFRYDLLMKLSWKILLPMLLLWFFFIFF